MTEAEEEEEEEEAEEAEEAEEEGEDVVAPWRRRAASPLKTPRVQMIRFKTTAKSSKLFKVSTAASDSNVTVSQHRLSG